MTQMPLPAMVASLVIPLVVMALWPRSRATEGPGFAAMLTITAIVVGFFAWQQYGAPYLDRSTGPRPTSTLHVLTSKPITICFEVYEERSSGTTYFTVRQQSLKYTSLPVCGSPRGTTEDPNAGPFAVLVVGTGDIVDALRREPKEYPGWVLVPQVLKTYDAAYEELINDETSNREIALGIVYLCGCDKDEVSTSTFAIPSTTGTRSSVTDRVVVHGPTIRNSLLTTYIDVDYRETSTTGVFANILPEQWFVYGSAPAENFISGAADNAWFQGLTSFYSFSVDDNDTPNRRWGAYEHNAGEAFAAASPITSWDPVGGKWVVGGNGLFQNTTALYELVAPQVSIVSESKVAARDRGLFILGTLFGVSGSFLAKGLEVWLMHLYKFDTLGIIRRRVAISRSRKKHRIDRESSDPE